MIKKRPCKFPEVEEELGDRDLAEISGDAAKNVKLVSFGFKQNGFLLSVDLISVT